MFMTLKLAHNHIPLPQRSFYVEMVLKVEIIVVELSIYSLNC